MNESVMAPVGADRNLRLPVGTDRNRRLPVGTVFRESTGLWGMMMLILTEAALFAYLLFSYFYVASQAPGAWPPFGPPKLAIASINTVILLLSSVCVWWADRAARRGSGAQVLLGLASGLILGIAFVGLQLLEWHGKPFTLSSDPYGSLFFTITGFHMLHVVVGLIMLAVMLTWASLGYFSKQRHAALSIGALYWHFVDAVWLAVFASLYVSTRLS
ncbi:MAG: putative cytochrome c oxidase subunit [Herminiimonas sp.]|nr:putative cytochrome c oxidase subunit [Herminiimonas sp.]